MQATLLQEKLDVTQKTRSNLFNWRGQFTPQLVEYLLSLYSKSGDTISDPFAGSGTVLLESINKNLSCFGFEINPAAYAMAKFYSISNLNFEARLNLLNCLEHKIRNLIQGFDVLPVFISLGNSFREQHKHLLEFASRLFTNLENELEKSLALNLLFLSESHKTFDVSASVLISFNRIKNFALSLPYTNKTISAYLQDARTVHLRCPNQFNLIVTSPPYINVFNYHQNHRAIMEATGWNMLNVAQSEFGANRKNRGNRFKTVIQYCIDIEEALHSFWHSLSETGIMVMVIGRESNVRSSPFYNGLIVKEIIENAGGFNPVSDHERVFVNKFGEKIKEDILVVQKTLIPPNKSVGGRIAIRHLENALITASGEIKPDISAAIVSADTVLASPLFNVEEAFQYA